MSLRLRANVDSTRARRHLEGHHRTHRSSVNKIASGTPASEGRGDASLAMAERLGVQARSVGQAMANLNAAVAELEVTGGALQSMSESLLRLRELAVQAGSDAWSPEQRAALQLEFTEQLREVKSRMGDSRLFDTVQPNIHIALDRSGSMGTVQNGQSRWQYAINALNDVADNIASNVRLAISVFTTRLAGDTGGELLLEMGSHGAGAIRASYQGVSVGGTTPTTQALDDILNEPVQGNRRYWLNDARDPLNDMRGRSVIVITDGTPDNNAFNSVPRTEAVSRQLLQSGSPVYWVGIPGASRDNLQRFALAGGSQNPNEDFNYYWAEDSTALRGAVQDIASLLVRGAPISVQGGADAHEVVTMQLLELPGLMTSLNNLLGTSGLETRESAVAAQEELDVFGAQVGLMQAWVGGMSNRLDARLDQLGLYGDELEVAKGRIVDVDYAREMANLLRSDILRQSSTAMLAQANTVARAALSLLG